MAEPSGHSGSYGSDAGLFGGRRRKTGRKGRKGRKSARKTGRRKSYKKGTNMKRGGAEPPKPGKAASMGK